MLGKVVGSDAQKTFSLLNIEGRLRRREPTADPAAIFQVTYEGACSHLDNPRATSPQELAAEAPAEALDI